LVIRERWAAALAAKHAAIGLMVLAAAYQTWFLHPRLARLALLERRGREADAAPALRSHARLTRLNLGLGIVVLILTAIARTA
jgi:putative copper export protein